MTERKTRAVKQPRVPKLIYMSEREAMERIERAKRAYAALQRRGATKDQLSVAQERIDDAWYDATIGKRTYWKIR